MMLKYKFFTRNGGVSSGLLDSLNFNSSKDEAKNIEQNTKVIASYFNIDFNSIKRVTQKHTNKVVVVNDKTQNTALIEADAIVTKIPNVVVSVITADCVPVLLHDHKNNIIAAVHAGWRGAFSNIIKNTVDEMEKIGGSASEIKAFIGPSIKQKSYEVDQLFYDSFLQNNKIYSDFFVPSSKQSHYLFDLPRFVSDKLHESGITNVKVHPDDTYSNEKLYFSCRRATHRKEAHFGCQLSGIMLEE